MSCSATHDSSSDVRLRTAAANITISFPGDDGCWHVSGFFHLGCPDHDFKHTVGYACWDCSYQWFLPGELWCEERPEGFLGTPKEGPAT